MSFVLNDMSSLAAADREGLVSPRVVACAVGNADRRDVGSGASVQGVREREPVVFLLD